MRLYFIVLRTSEQLYYQFITYTRVRFASINYGRMLAVAYGRVITSMRIICTNNYVCVDESRETKASKKKSEDGPRTRIDFIIFIISFSRIRRVFDFVFISGFLCRFLLALDGASACF